MCSVYMLLSVLARPCRSHPRLLGSCAVGKRLGFVRRRSYSGRMASDVPWLLTADALAEAAYDAPDSRVFRAEVVRRLRGIVDFDWYVFALTDPVTGVGIDPVARIPDGERPHARSGSNTSPRRIDGRRSMWPHPSAPARRRAACGARCRTPPGSSTWHRSSFASTRTAGASSISGRGDLSRPTISPCFARSHRASRRPCASPAAAPSTDRPRHRRPMAPRWCSSTTRCSSSAKRRIPPVAAAPAADAGSADAHPRRRLQRGSAAARSRGGSRRQRTVGPDAGIRRIVGPGERRPRGADTRHRGHDRADVDRGASRPVRARATPCRRASGRSCSSCRAGRRPPRSRHACSSRRTRFRTT